MKIVISGQKRSKLLLCFRPTSYYFQQIPRLRKTHFICWHSSAQFVRKVTQRRYIFLMQNCEQRQKSIYLSWFWNQFLPCNGPYRSKCKNGQNRCAIQTVEQSAKFRIQFLKKPRAWGLELGLWYGSCFNARKSDMATYDVIVGANSANVTLNLVQSEASEIGGWLKRRNDQGLRNWEASYLSSISA